MEVQHGYILHPHFHPAAFRSVLKPSFSSCYFLSPSVNSMCLLLLFDSFFFFKASVLIVQTLLIEQ